MKSLSKFPVPILAGDPPPRPPPPLPPGKKPTAARRRKQDLVARYYLTLFRPWRVDTVNTMQFSWRAWQDFQAELEKTARLELVGASEDSDADTEDAETRDEHHAEGDPGEDPGEDPSRDSGGHSAETQAQTGKAGARIVLSIKRCD